MPMPAVLLAPLGFGHANVVVAVPQAWIDVRTMADLDDVAASMRARSTAASCGSRPNT
jgi:ATP phosphoribosyltransferase